MLRLKKELKARARQDPSIMETVTLLCVCLLGFSYSLEIKQIEDVYEDLWNNNIDIARQTLKVDFLRQMETGSLQAERYINFTIQDINYLLQVTMMLNDLSIKVTAPPDLSKFFKDRYSSYKDFADSMLKQYFFKGNPLIQETPAMKNYLSFYNELMKDPLYFAVGLLPCSRLWVWLANEMNIPPTNAYYTWRMDNKDGHPEKHYKDLLNKYLNTPDKVKRANDVFRTQMQNEHDFFFSS